MVENVGRFRFREPRQIMQYGCLPYLDLADIDIFAWGNTEMKALADLEEQLEVLWAEYVEDGQAVLKPDALALRDRAMAALEVVS